MINLIALYDSIDLYIPTSVIFFVHFNLWFVAVCPWYIRFTCNGHYSFHNHCKAKCIISYDTTSYNYTTIKWTCSEWWNTSFGFENAILNRSFVEQHMLEKPAPVHAHLWWLWRTSCYKVDSKSRNVWAKHVAVPQHPDKFLPLSTDKHSQRANVSICLPSSTVKLSASG